ncbi:MAG: DsbA family oxidoreductase [Burkholderiaceae bacterium]
MVTDDAPNGLQPLAIDVISDVVCPWCWIGKRRLEEALTQLPAEGEKPVVRWHPFELNPDIPPGGVDRRSYLEQKFGGPERARRVYERVMAAGREVGIPFNFDGIVRQPNTRDAHRLIAWAQTANPSVASALVERLFRAYFIEGVDIGDLDALARLAGEAGFDASEVITWLRTDSERAAIAAAEEHAHRLGVSGVPFFIFNQRLAVSGAQPPEVLLDAIGQALAA